MPEIFEAVRLLRAAAKAHLAGDRQQAADLIRCADMPEIGLWTEKLWGKRSEEVHRFRPVSDAPPRSAAEKREYMPRAVEKVLIGKYGYECAFCSTPLVRSVVRLRIAKLYPDALRWGPRNKDQHTAFQAMALHIDHALPLSRGGTNQVENLLLACAPCNCGRMEFTLAELDLADPRERQPDHSDWNGLEDFR